MQIKDLLKIISSDLNLSYESQDWGIINSDGNRVYEFINYYLVNYNFSDNIKYQLFDLIIASFNDLVLDKENDEKTTNYFISFVENNNREPFINILLYWKRIYNEEEFPVSKYFPC